MKINSFCIIFFSSCIFSIISCNKASIKDNDNKLNNFKVQEINNVISSLNKKYLVTDSAIGEISINKTKEEGLAIVIQFNDSVNQVMAFSYQDSLNYDFAYNSVRNLGTAKVYFFRDLGTSIIISPKEEKAYIFAVDDILYTNERIPEIINLFKKNGINSISYKGYELGRYSGSWKTTIATDTINNKNFSKLLLANSLLSARSKGGRMAKTADDANCPPGMKAITCQSGGAGSSSCSSDGCSVSCSAGYTACCTYGVIPACRCSNKPAGPNTYCVPVD